MRVKEHTDNVAGVKIPKFDYYKDAGDSKMALTGLSAGGAQVRVPLPDQIACVKICPSACGSCMSEGSEFTCG